MNIRGVHIQGSGDEREFSVVEDNDFANNTSLLSFFLTECDMIFFSAQVTSGTECFFDLEFTPFTYQTWELIANPVILSWWDDGDFTDDDISLSKISQDDIFMSTIPGKQGQSNSLVPTSVVTIEFAHDVSYSHKDNTVAIFQGSTVRFEVQHLNEKW